MPTFFGKSRTYRGRGEVGNALMVRGEIKDVEVLQLRGDWHKITAFGHRIKLVPEPRSALLATAVMKDYEVSVGVIHSGGDRRKEQLALAAIALMTRPAPRILLGDFNLHNHEAAACLEPFGFTVPKGPNTSPAHAPRQQIDQIAVQGLHIVNMFVQTGLPISDHVPLMAKAKLL